MDDLPGFRFFPTEEELVSFYLRNKLDGRRPDLERLTHRVVPVLDIYEFNPWEIPQFSGEMCRGDPEQWFFFIPRQECEARGGRPKRLTTSGYWKATGSPGYVYSSGNRTVGVKRTMVFYGGRAPSGKKTEWKMNEYKAIEGEDFSSTAGAIPKLRHEYSLCRVYKQSKSLRVFDRRPAAPTGTVTYQQEQEATESSKLRNSLGKEIVRGSSTGSGFSGDDEDPTTAPPSQDAGQGDDPTDMHWDQLNMFYGMD